MSVMGEGVTVLKAGGQKVAESVYMYMCKYSVFPHVHCNVCLFLE